jgi:hypothetical protein
VFPVVQQYGRQLVVAKLMPRHYGPKLLGSIHIEGETFYKLHQLPKCSE